MHRAVIGRPSTPSQDAPDKPGQIPFALLEAGAKGLRIAAANQTAKAFGVAPGLSFSDAKARAPALVTEDIDRAADAEALEKLGAWLIRFTPLVSIDGEDGLILEMTGCAHLYGGEPEMLALLKARLETAHIPHRLALASTPAAAHALARAAAEGTILVDGEEHEGLLQLPVSALRLSDAAETGLRRFGLTRIGQLYGIDRRALGQRFQSRSLADNVCLRLDQALGLRTEPLEYLRPPPDQSVRLSCPDPITDASAIWPHLEQLVEELCAILSERGEGGQSFLFHACRADGTSDTVSVATARPSRQASHLLRLFRDRIETLDPGYGIDLFVLEARRTGPLNVAATSFSGSFATRENDEAALASLADRIGARLGESMVRITRFRDSHLPMQAEFETDFDGTFPSPDAAMRNRNRPLRLFATPEPVTVLASVPDGPPLRFVWRRVSRNVARADGPERIAPEWWQYLPAAPEQGVEASAPNLPRTQDYYRIEDAEGRRYWIFRDGLYEDGRGGPPQWFIHGLFA